MSKTKFTVNNAGVREMLHWKSLQSVCNEYAQKVANRAGSGYEISERDYPRRIGAAVIATTKEARTDNKKNNTLLKALGAAK